MTATAKKQKPLKRHPSKLKKMSAYMILTLILISIVAVLFAFPLYWIITGSFKTGAAINATTPEWWPSQWVLTNYQKLFAGKSAPLWQLAVPFSHSFSADGEPIYFSVGPTAPAALRWMINTVFMAVMSMILTCITAAMAGYALAKKRFVVSGHSGSHRRTGTGKSWSSFASNSAPRPCPRGAAAIRCFSARYNPEGSRPAPPQ